MSEDTSIGINFIDEANNNTLRKALVRAAAVSSGVAAGWWETAEAVARMDAALTELNAAIAIVEVEWVVVEGDGEDGGTGGG